MTEAFPLKWPLGRARTHYLQRENARFETTMGRARDELLAELDRMRATDVVISSNVATYRRAGREIMYADQTASKSDPGIAVYYTWKGEQYVLACDKWATVTDNLQALNKTVNAIRGIARWGTGEMMRAAFAGFKELPPVPSGERPWWDVMGLDESDPMSLIEVTYRMLRKQKHPDSGGSHDEFIELQRAYTDAKHKHGIF